MKEEWRSIKNYEGKYEVSNTGLVRSLPRYQLNYKGSKQWNQGRILRPGKGSNGYLFVNLSSDGKTEVLWIHRLVCITFVSNPHNYNQVNHKDGVKDNNVLENLEWVTASRNVKHAYEIGKHKPRGPERKHIDNLSFVLSLAKEGKSYREIAKITGIGRTTVLAMIRGEKGYII